MEQQDRLHSLDAVRAFALLLGIAFHATMSFVASLTAVGWPIADNSQSDSLAAGFYVTHIFRMTTFFVIAGFFARLVVYRKGLAGFIKDRRKRILMPLLVSWPIQMALMGAAIIWAITKAGKPFAPPPPTGEHVLIPFGWGHLWFLYMLLLLYAVVIGVRWLANTAIDKHGDLRRVVDRVIAKLTAVPLAPIFLAIPVGLSLYAMEWWNFWIGIPTPDNSIIPNLAAFVGYGTALTFGWFVHRQVGLLQTFERFWLVYLAAALALTVLCYSMVGMPTIPVHLDTTARVIYSGAYSMASWCWTFAIIGAAIKFLSGESKTRRYLADASYWMYIMHLPLVFGLQALMMFWPLHWSVKYPLILGVTFALLLLSYHYWVRPTYIGEVLNGRRYPRGSKASAETTQGSGHSINAQATPTLGDSLAALRDVRKSYGSVLALDGLNLEIKRGELLAFLGPNGAGKSTAIALMLGLQQPSSGTVELFGQSPYQIEARRRIGVMMQEVTLAPELKVREHIDLISSYYPSPLSVEETIAVTRIEELADRPYRKLSGGQKRQVQFAMAVCGRPQLLFLDEPTVGLDIKAREAMWKTIRQLLTQGVSIVLTTHYLEEAEALADRVVVINKGRVIASGSVNDLRAIVSRRLVSCVTRVPMEHIRGWSEVESVEHDGKRLSITTTHAELVVRRLLAEDAHLVDLEVRRAGLTEAFTELTQEAA